MLYSKRFEGGRILTGFYLNSLTFSFLRKRPPLLFSFSHNRKGQKEPEFMEDLYSIHPGIARANTASAGELSAMQAEEVVTAAAAGITDLRKARIASHPLYPSLLSAYIDCRKVGAPPETVTVLEKIARERNGEAAAAIGADPELDEFMDSYYRLLVRYKDELSKPFNDAVSFLATIESQLRNLCKASAVASSSSFAAAGGGAATADAVSSPSDEALGSSDEEPAYWDVDASESHDSLTQVFENYELKEMLLKKYSVHLTSLRTEFLKKRKKGKLPKDARLTLLDWWNYHYQWPYPTEEEKAKLAELTGLDQKQINNWFINQRKRHWKPSEDMQSALVEGLCGGSRLTTLCFETGTIGP